MAGNPASVFAGAATARIPIAANEKCGRSLEKNCTPDDDGAADANSRRRTA